MCVPQAIDLIDEAGSRARIEAYMARVGTGGNAPPQRQPWQELAQVMQAKTEAAKVSRLWLPSRVSPTHPDTSCGCDC